MSALVPFDFEGLAVRVLDLGGAPWFVLADVCRVLGIANASNAAGRLDGDEKNTLALTEGIRGNPNVTIISEPGLYRLVMRSDKPAARRFQKWVTAEVLPAIRRTGGYGTADIDAKVEQALARTLKALLPALVEPLIDARVAADGRVALADYLSTREILDRERVPSKGRRGLVVAVSSALRKWCASPEIQALPKTCARTGTWLFPAAVVPGWLKNEGRARIARHRARLEGQAVLPFFPKRPK